MKNHKQITVLLLFLCLLLSFAACGKKYKGPITKAQAVEIAEDTWKKEYKIGDEELELYRPYEIKLINGIWMIKGEWNYKFVLSILRIEILEKDGKVTVVSIGN